MKFAVLAQTNEKGTLKWLVRNQFKELNKKKHLVQYLH